MIYFLHGQIEKKYENYAIINVAGIGFKVFFSQTSIKELPVNEAVKIFIHTHIKQDSLDLYGFNNELELQLFNKLTSVSSVGPKSAISILGVAKPDQVIAAIQKSEASLLARASGIGKKTAERIVVELRDKMVMPQEKRESTLSLMESDIEIEETLMALGYKKQHAKDIVAKIDKNLASFKDRLKDALKKAKN